MFTFGHAHELQHALARVSAPEQQVLVRTLIDAVHERIAGRCDDTCLCAALREALVRGKSGTWEMAAMWLRKCSADFPAVNTLWPELAAHRLANVRWRVAACLDDVPADLRPHLATALCNDASAKVAEKARIWLDERQRDDDSDHSSEDFSS